jgi:hypothetical protein
MYILKFAGLNPAYATTINVSVYQEVYDRLTDQIRKTVSIMHGSFNEWVTLICVTFEVEISIEIWFKLM